MSDWQPIETAPNTGRDGDWSPILVSDGMGVYEAFFDTDAECWVRANLSLSDEDAIVHPTHWMPLPSPPRQG